MRAILSGILLLCTLISYSQSWVPMNGFGSLTLRDIFFINENIGWVVGNGGTIYYTSDGGQNWTTQNSGVTVNLFDVHFIDPNVGWISAGEQILHTTNGGSSWQVIWTDTLTQEFTLNSVAFIDADTGWAGGTMYPSGEGILMQTTNGGEEWYGVEGYVLGAFPFEWKPIQVDGVADMQVINGDSVVAVGGGGNSPNVISWNRSPFGPSSTRWENNSTSPVCPLNRVHFLNSEEAWVTGKFTYASSSRGGYWEKATDPLGDTLNSLLWGYSVFFSSMDTGWVGGNGGRLVYTEDGGDTWTRQYEQPDGTLIRDIHFTKPGTGFACGSYGLMLRYDSTTNNDTSVTAIASDFVEEAQPFDIYPNPADDVIKLSYFKGTKVEIFDIKGASVIVQELSRFEDIETIDVHALEPGVYVVKLINFNDVLGVRKFIKK